MTSRRGVHTRKRGLDREEKKLLLLKHLQKCGNQGCKFDELSQVLPALSRFQIHSLLKELKEKNKIKSVGKTKAGRWYAL